MQSFIKTLKHLNRQRRQQTKDKELQGLLRRPTENVQMAIADASGKIPVLVIAYNNGIYVEAMVTQLQKFGIKPIVLDNCSNDAGTLAILTSLSQSGVASVVRMPKNFGHMVGFLYPIYDSLPEVFAYTDPDIRFHPQMPAGFLEDLAGLTKRFMSFKAGLAMDLHADKDLSNATVRLTSNEPIVIDRTFTVTDGEAPFWVRKLEHESFDVYAAKIDTIFAVYRKSNYRGDFFDGVRLAGKYSAAHLPWYPSLDPMSAQQKIKYLEGNVSTTWLNKNL